MFPGGTAPPQDYQGPREAKDIVEHATKVMPTFVKRATSAKEAEALRAKVSLSRIDRNLLPRAVALMTAFVVITRSGQIEARGFALHRLGDRDSAVQSALDRISQVNGILRCAECQDWRRRLEGVWRGQGASVGLAGRRSSEEIRRRVSVRARAVI